MKYLISLCTVLFLVSCGEVTAPTETPKAETQVEAQKSVETKEEEKTDTPIVDSADAEIAAEMEKLEETATTETSENKIVKGTYKNPKGEVHMEISYSLDADNKIADISVTSGDYDLAEFSQKINKEAIGKTVDEAAEIYISGSSLTTEAYQQAMKTAK